MLVVNKSDAVFNKLIVVGFFNKKHVEINKNLCPVLIKTAVNT